jgi:UDP-N-acetylmuramate: L-alanyl-gamma-D-glutamyl-meso-diaminopimelate ligase
VGFARRDGPLGERVGFADTVDALVQKLADEAKPGDQVLIMSNGGFGGLHEKAAGGAA